MRSPKRELPLFDKLTIFVKIVEWVLRIASCRGGNIFARFGYRRASMSQIAEEAGLTRQASIIITRARRHCSGRFVEDLHALAYEAEASAGLDQEKAGGGLADILAAQMVPAFVISSNASRSRRSRRTIIGASASDP